MIRPMLTLHNALRHWGTYTPEKTALMSQRRDWSFREVSEWADQVSAALTSRKTKGRAVAVATPDDAYAVATWVGIARAGSTFVPLREIYTSKQAERLLVRAGIRGLVVDPASSLAGISQSASEGEFQ